MKKVSVSILSKEDKFLNIEKLNESSCDYIHLDIMDGKFVDNKFISLQELPKVLEKIKKPIDVHLMVKDPTKYIKKLAYWDVSYITIHYEIKNYEKYLKMIKEYGFKVGLAINPSTSIDSIINELDKINMILVMSVNPGYSGQTFINESKEKINRLKEEIKRKNLQVKIGVDGGICDSTLSDISNADIVVSASYVLQDLNNIEKIKAA